MTQCFKITQNVPFEIFNWGIFHQCLSGSTVWPKTSVLKTSPKRTTLGTFYERSSTPNVNVAGFSPYWIFRTATVWKKKNPRKSSWDFQHCRGGLIPLLWSVAHFPSRDYFLMMLHDDNTTTTTTVEELTLSTSSLKLPFKLLLLWLWDEL